MSTTYKELLLQVSEKLEETGNTTAMVVARRIKENPTLDGAKLVILNTENASLDVWFTMIRGGLNDKGNVLVEVPKRAEIKGLPLEMVSIDEMAGQVITLDTLEVYLERLMEK